MTVQCLACQMLSWTLAMGMCVFDAKIPFLPWSSADSGWPRVVPTPRQGNW